MAVQVALTFNSVDEAIVALAKLVAAGGKVAPQPAAAPQPVEKKERKGRSDAGQPRGPHKKDEPNATGADTGAAQGAPASAAEATPARAAVQAGTTDPRTTAHNAGPSTSTTPAPVPTAPVAPPSPDDVQKAVEKLFNAKGYEDTHATLSRFGVTRGKDLTPDQRADFIAKAEAVVAGGAI